MKALPKAKLAESRDTPRPMRLPRQAYDGDRRHAARPTAQAAQGLAGA